MRSLRVFLKWIEVSISTYIKKTNYNYDTPKIHKYTFVFIYVNVLFIYNKHRLFGKGN